jgi:hypothetical protein
MSITEQQRHQLFTWFEEAMGSERAANMMELLPPVGWADVATKPDVLRLQDDVRELRMEIRTDVRALRDEVAASGRTYVRWLLASHAIIVSAIGVAAGLTAAFG